MVAQYVLLARFSLNDGEVFGQQSFQNARMYIFNVGTIITLPKIAPLFVVVKRTRESMSSSGRWCLALSL